MAKSSVELDASQRQHRQCIHPKKSAKGDRAGKPRKAATPGNVALMVGNAYVRTGGVIQEEPC